MKSLAWIKADERKRCTHDSQHGLWWLHGQWVDWTVALSHRMRWGQMAAHRCNGCAAWMPMAVSNDAIPYREFGLARDIATDPDAADRHIEWWANRTDGYVDEIETPSVNSKWIHKGCKRTCIVDSVRGELVEYHYVRTAGTEGLMRSRATPKQTMALGEWIKLFTTRAAS